MFVLLYNYNLYYYHHPLKNINMQTKIKNSSESMNIEARLPQLLYIYLYVKWLLGYRLVTMMYNFMFDLVRILVLCIRELTIKTVYTF